MTRTLLVAVAAALALGGGARAALAPDAMVGGRGALAADVAAVRVATAKYATSLARAKRDGYTMQITRMMPNMGYHFLNPDVAGPVDVTKPPILVYVRQDGRWQLVAFEWVFTERPERKPLPGARYGSFPAACHYADGTWHKAASEGGCSAKSPESGAAFSFWHPRLVTLHLWAWYHNPRGIFHGTNPLVAPFNEG